MSNDQDVLIKKDPLEELKERANSALRVQEGAGIGFTAVSGIFTEFFDDDNAESGVLSNGIGALSGTLTALGWVLLRKKAPTAWQNRLLNWQNRLTNGINPGLRRFKTAFVVGQKAGELVGNFIPLPHSIPGIQLSKKIISKVLGYIVGIFSGIGGVVVFKSNLSEEEEKLLKFGSDGWTKYGKTGFILGNSIGATIGGLLGTFVFPGLGTLAGIAIGSAIGSLAGFTVSLLGTPIINKLRNRYSKAAKRTKEKLEEDHSPTSFHNYRTNYIRCGITFGGSLGTIIGGILGSFIFPGLGTVAGAALGLAIGGVIGGAAYGVIGPYVSRCFDAGKDENGKNIAASTHDYAFRTGAMVVNNRTGAMVGSNNSLGQVGSLGPAAGAVTLGLLGVAREFYHAHQLKKHGRKDEDHILPWTQRAASGVMIGSAIFGLIGFFAFPPFGAFIGAGIGGILGGVTACLAEPLLRKLNIIPKLPIAEDIKQPDPDISPQPSAATPIPKAPNKSSNPERKISSSYSEIDRNLNRQKQISSLLGNAPSHAIGFTNPQNTTTTTSASLNYLQTHFSNKSKPQQITEKKMVTTCSRTSFQPASLN